MWDILVLNDYQNQEIGTKLMHQILNKYAHILQKSIVNYRSDFRILKVA
ncbi:hypothetical protein [Staphylococcus simulans]|nr:hypothetical protein [Staphylococcus simulans]